MAVAFTDGHAIGATLDRNGLRPGRWLETTDGWVVSLGDRRDGRARRPGARAACGQLFLVDLERGVIVDDADVKRRSRAPPYGKWFERDRPPRRPAGGAAAPEARAAPRAPAFGFTQEDLRVLLAPTAAKAEEPIGSMGNDSRRRAVGPPAAAVQLLQAALRAGHEPADRPDPRVDRHEHRTGVGSERNLLDETPEHAHQLSMLTPILFDRETQQLRHVDSLIFQAHGRHHLADLRLDGMARRSTACAVRPTMRSPTASTS